VKSSLCFRATKEPADISVVVYEKGGVTTPLEERPAVRFSGSYTACDPERDEW